MYYYYKCAAIHKCGAKLPELSSTHDDDEFDASSVRIINVMCIVRDLIAHATRTALFV